MIAVYPGTFDPFTNGHLDLLERSVRVFPKVILAVASSTSKKTLLNSKERLDIARTVTADISGIELMLFDGLLVDFVSSVNAGVIIRGLRAVSDFEYEFQLAAMNRNLASKIETMFLTPSEKYSFISSSMIKDVVRLGGNVDTYLHPVAIKKLQDKLIN